MPRFRVYKILLMCKLVVYYLCMCMCDILNRDYPQLPCTIMKHFLKIKLSKQRMNYQLKLSLEWLRTQAVVVGGSITQASAGYAIPHIVLD